MAQDQLAHALLLGTAGGVAASRLGDGSTAQAGSACTGPVTPLVVASSVDKSALLTRFAASPERVTWWRERIARCYALLAAPTRGTTTTPR